MPTCGNLVDVPCSHAPSLSCSSSFSMFFPGFAISCKLEFVIDHDSEQTLPGAWVPGKGMAGLVLPVRAPKPLVGASVPL